MTKKILLKTEEEEVNERIQAEIKRVTKDEKMIEFLLYAVTDEITSPSKHMQQTDKDRYCEKIRGIVVPQLPKDETH